MDVQPLRPLASKRFARAFCSADSKTGRHWAGKFKTKGALVAHCTGSRAGSLHHPVAVMAFHIPRFSRIGPGCAGCAGCR